MAQHRANRRTRKAMRDATRGTTPPAAAPRARGTKRGGADHGGEVEVPAPARSFPDPSAFAPDDPRMVEARRCLRIVLFAEQAGGNWTSRTAAVAAEIAKPALPPEERLDGPAPSRQTLTRWFGDFVASGRRLAGLITPPSMGRTPDEMDAGVEAHLRAVLKAAPATMPTKLLASATAYAETERTEHGRAVTLPSVHALRRLRNAIPLEERLMAAFGTKATRARAVPKATIPASRANEWWFVDEVSFRTWMRIWDPRGIEQLLRDGVAPEELQGEALRRAAGTLWVPAKAKGVFVLDGYARAILSHWVKEPTPLLPQNTHFTAEEVLAVIAGAITPDLAHPESAHFAVGEPAHFRIDGSGPMASAALKLKGLGLSCPTGEPDAAWIRGKIERYFRTLKQRDLADITGDADLFVPFDPEGDDPRTERTRNNGDTSRLVPYRHEVPVRKLADIRQIRALVQWAVNQHNRTPSRRLRGETPLSAWLRTAPEPAPAVVNLAAEFPTHEVLVTDSGVEVDSVLYQSNGLHGVFGMREKVFVRKDPLERGVYVFPLNPSVRARTPGLFVPNQAAWVRSLAPREFIEQNRAAVADLRAEVNEARRQVLVSQIGEGAVSEIEADRAERSRALDAKSRKVQRMEKARRKKEAEKAQHRLPLGAAPRDDAQQVAPEGPQPLASAPPASARPAAKVVPRVAPRGAPGATTEPRVEPAAQSAVLTAESAVGGPEVLRPPSDDVARTGSKSTPPPPTAAALAPAPRQSAPRPASTPAPDACDSDAREGGAREGGAREGGARVLPFRRKPQRSVFQVSFVDDDGSDLPAPQESPTSRGEATA